MQNEDGSRTRSYAITGATNLMKSTGKKLENFRIRWAMDQVFSAVLQIPEVKELSLLEETRSQTLLATISSAVDKIDDPTVLSRIHSTLATGLYNPDFVKPGKDRYLLQIGCVFGERYALTKKTGGELSLSTSDTSDPETAPMSARFNEKLLDKYDKLELADIKDRAFMDLHLVPFGNSTPTGYSEKSRLLIRHDIDSLEKLHIAGRNIEFVASATNPLMAAALLMNLPEAEILFIDDGVVEEEHTEPGEVYLQDKKSILRRLAAARKKDRENGGTTAVMVYIEADKLPKSTENQENIISSCYKCIKAEPELARRVYAKLASHEAKLAMDNWSEGANSLNSNLAAEHAGEIIETIVAEVRKEAIKSLLTYN